MTARASAAIAAALLSLAADSGAQDLDLRSDDASNFLEEPCAIGRAFLPKGTRCGMLVVPENRDAPLGRGRSLLIPVMQLGPLNYSNMAVVLGGGGPGGSVGMGTPPEIEFWERFRAGVLGPDRGLLLVEQRGVDEEPALKCEEIRREVEWVMAADLTTEDESDVMDAAATQCLRRLQGEGVGLRHYTTRASAEDFEDLRRALGIERLDLIAVSYASLIAFDLMERYPGSVRTALFDSPLIPESEPLQDAVYLDRMFSRLSEKCLSLPPCSSSYGDMSRNLRVAARRLAATPATVPIAGPRPRDPGGRMLLNAQRMISTVEFAFYRRELLDQLPRYLHELAIFGDSELAPNYAGNLARFYRLGDLAEALHYSIVCRERIPFVSDAPPESGFEWTLARTLPLAKEFCAGVWNLGDAIEPGNLAKLGNSGHPMLFLTGTLDPLTPEEVTVDAIAGMADARHASVNSTHAVLFNNSCALRVASAFMQDPEGIVYDPCLDRQAPNFP